jgi:hypothetical protein
MDAAVPPLPPAALHAPAAPVRVSPQQVQLALERLRATNPGTTFVSAEASQVPGLIKITLANGKLAYADKSGRYLFVGIIFDMTAGKPLDGALDAVNQTPTGDFQP